MDNVRSYEDYTDIYFLRSREILTKLKLDPFVRAQIFIRSGPGKAYGFSEIASILQRYSTITKNGGKIYSLTDGDTYTSCETILVIEARIQDIITLETMMLGVMSRATTQENDHHGVDPKDVTSRVKKIVSLVGPRPVYYFGARHWHYTKDAEISKAAMMGGAISCSTTIGAATMNRLPVGTIPHSLEAIFAWKYGNNTAVLESIRAFHRSINTDVPRIALVDWRNKEIDDAVMVARVLQHDLSGVRVDTCYENVMQGSDGEHGVSVSGVYALRCALNDAGFGWVTITLSSGFGDSEKVKKFVTAEKKTGNTLI